ncbi:DUF1648 domain-containing protein [Streptomyces sp. NPDC088394]|uniref:DUF1648 domain-containing protein n=2 Tax=Streptomyces TaxID=1883 RepID=UPI0037FA3AC4
MAIGQGPLSPDRCPLEQARMVDMPPTSSTVNLSRRAAVLIAPFAGGALASAIAFLLLRDSFPDRVPTHFALDGTPDRFSS